MSSRSAITDKDCYLVILGRVEGYKTLIHTIM